MPGCLDANKISFVRQSNVVLKHILEISLKMQKNVALMVQAEAALYMNHMGRWEKSRGMQWNRGTKRLPPSFSSQPETLPTAESNRLARFKISANQSVIPPPSLLTLTPVFCSADVPRGFGAPLIVQRIISYCLFFEMAFSCETLRKHANTNWHLIPQAPHRCQLCSHGGGQQQGVLCWGTRGSGGKLPDRKWSLTERGEQPGSLKAK